MTESTKDSTSGVRSLQILSRLTTAFLGACRMPHRARIDNLQNAQRSLSMLRKIYVVTRLPCEKMYFEMHGSSTVLQQARVCVVFCFPHKTYLGQIPCRRQFACCLLSTICKSPACPAPLLLQGKKLCRVNMGQKCLKGENFILGNDILGGGG